MKRFIINILVFSFTLTGIVFTLTAFLRSYIHSNGYMAAIIEKHACMNRNLPPRIVLIGDSNLVFGLDSKTIENELGFPVCNLGLHAGLGLNFILSEALDLIRPTDIVILTTAWNLGSGDPAEKAAVQVELPATFKYSYKDGKINSLKTFAAIPYFIVRNDFAALRQLLPNHDNYVYIRSGFNQWGDLLRHTEDAYIRPPMIFDPTNELQPFFNDLTYLKTIKDFDSLLLKNKIKFIYSFPPYPKTLYINESDRLAKYEENIRSILNSEQIIGDRKSFVFDGVMFYDTKYHLNKAGRELRTQVLINLLQPIIPVHR